MTRPLCILTEEAIDPVGPLAGMIAAPDGAGAIASFVGVARPTSKDGKALDALFLDHHPRLTIASLEAIAAETQERFKVGQLVVMHRCGSVAAGDPIVFVAATSAHRRAALDAVDYLMDRLKTDAMFWKREDGPDHRQWIEPTVADEEARERWGN